MSYYPKEHPLVTEKDTTKKSIILRSVALGIVLGIAAGIAGILFCEQGYDDWLHWADYDNRDFYAFFLPFLVALSLEISFSTIINYCEKLYDAQIEALECANEAKINTEIILKTMPEELLPKFMTEPQKKPAETPHSSAEPTTVESVSCPRCGALQRADRKYCIKCGTNLADPSAMRRCPSCNAMILSDGHTCTICGASLQ